MKKKKNEVRKKDEKITTVRIPKDTWVQLRRLQEVNKIKSIHQACLDGLELIIKQGQKSGKEGKNVSAGHKTDQKERSKKRTLL